MTNKWNRKDIFLPFNPANSYCVGLLSGTDNANSQPGNQKHRGYNTHIKIAYQHLPTAASYIFVLSIIPPFKTSSQIFLAAKLKNQYPLHNGFAGRSIKHL